MPQEQILKIAKTFFGVKSYSDSDAVTISLIKRRDGRYNLLMIDYEDNAVSDGISWHLNLSNPELAKLRVML